MATCSLTPETLSPWLKNKNVIKVFWRPEWQHTGKLDRKQSMSMWGQASLRRVLKLMHQMSHGRSISTWLAADSISWQERTLSTKCQRSCHRVAVNSSSWITESHQLSFLACDNIWNAKCNGYLEKKKGHVSLFKCKCKTEQLWR